MRVTVKKKNKPCQQRPRTESEEIQQFLYDCDKKQAVIAIIAYIGCIVLVLGCGIGMVLALAAI